MFRGIRILSVFVAAACLQATPVTAAERGSQVELDRIVAHVGGRIITQSDVRQARVLKLVDDVSSDATAERGLEDRWLILGEMTRGVPIAPPSEAEVAAHRAEWVSGLGGGAQLGALLARAGMNEAEVTPWLADDLRIRAYLARQFGMLPDGDRAKATADWLQRLRQRAGLP